MEMYQVRYFLSVSETLNFTRAAEICGVSQPALTKAIQKLEQELGGPLLVRDKRRVSLTPLGMFMREQFSRVDAAWSEALDSVRAFHGLERAVLNLAIMCTVGPSMTMDFLTRFQQDNPGVALNMEDMVPEKLEKSVLSGDVEIGLFGLAKPLDSRFRCLRIYQEPMVMVFPVGHPFEAASRVSIDDIQSENYVDRLHCEFRHAFMDLLDERKLTFEIPYRSEREDWVQNMIASGFGVSVMPEYSVTLPGLHFRPVTNPDLMRDVAIVTAADRPLSPAAQTLLAAAEAYCWPDVQ